MVQAKVKTGRRCTVCAHPSRNDIDRLLLDPTTSQSEIARIYGLHQRNICRHRQVHLSSLLKSEAAQKLVASEASRGASLIEQVGVLGDRAIEILNKAESTRNHDTAIRAIREARGCLELQAKLSGDISEGTTINVLFNNPSWLTLQGNIIEALLPYPDARAAVVAVLAPPN